MIWLVFFPIWFAYQAKKDGRNPWGWGLVGLLLALFSFVVAHLIARNLFLLISDRSLFTLIAVNSFAQFVPIFGIVFYGFKIFHIDERRKK
jgi:hypothetical protein